MAVPFDLGTLEVTGDSVPVVQRDGESLPGSRGKFALYQGALALGPPPRRPSLPRPAAADEPGAVVGKRAPKLFFKYMAGTG